jgi:hypothetical protein
MGFGLKPGSQRPAGKSASRTPRSTTSLTGPKNGRIAGHAGVRPRPRRRMPRCSRPAPARRFRADARGRRLAPSRRAREGVGPHVAESKNIYEEQGDTTIPFSHRARRSTGVQSGVRVGGLSSRPVREFADRSFRTRRSCSFWTARRRCSFWTARGCRSFSTSERGRPNGRLLRWRRLPDLSQSRGSPPGARPVRSGSRRQAAVAAQRVNCGAGCEHCAAVGPSHALRRLGRRVAALTKSSKRLFLCARILPYTNQPIGAPINLSSRVITIVTLSVFASNTRLSSLLPR